ncbi:MAG: hypothetical protein AB7J63_09905, partial [Vicinamibacterales bacterium]
MRPAIGVVVFASQLLLLCSCGPRALDATAALAAIEQNPASTDLGTKGLQIEGIAQADGSAEAIARVKVDETSQNWRFRRYDTGWQWEMVETRSGGWIDAEAAARNIVESRRLARAMDWASRNRSDYEQTFRSMDDFSQNLPRRTEVPLNVETWDQGRSIMAALVRHGGLSPVEKEERLKSLEGPMFDAWGSEILMSFNDESRSATFLSVGADKLKGTNDDVICVVSGAKAWDDSYE